MKKIKYNIAVCMFLLFATSLFVSCELDGPIAIYKIVINVNQSMLPSDVVRNVAAINEDFGNNPCEKDFAVSQFREVCNELQAFYDYNRGELIWDDFSFDVCLYNISSYEGGTEGLLVEHMIISYSSK